jgi:pimeloyl-ACP methyl ester carboxylesterase
MKLSVPSKTLLKATVLVAGLFTAGGILAATPECAISKNTVSLTDGNMAYETVGSGQPVVLVHGLFANKEQWNPMVCKLAAAGWQVVVPDLPGFGASTDFKAADDYKLERQVEHLDQFLTALKLPTIQLAGNSIFSANNAPAAERCLPGAKVVMLEKSGHLPQYEDADAMVAAWLEFQAGLAATPKQ